MKKIFTTLLFLLSLCLAPLSYAMTRLTQHPTDYSFLVISDIHLNTHATQPMEINPAKPDEKNDLDQKTFSHLIDTLADKVHAKTLQPNFILVLGDITGHERPSSTSVLDSETAVFQQLKNHFPTTPLFYIFGNNDSLDLNYGPFYSKSQNRSPYTIAQENGWKDGFLSTGTLCATGHYPCLETKDITNGYYTAYLQPNLKLIALNSVIFSPRRTQVTAQDAQTELDWLKTQLELARTQNESVIIAMHIPPGKNIFDDSEFWVTHDSAEFIKIMAEYKTTVIGILSSHTHSEEIKIIRDQATNVIPVIFAPGLSTSHGNAPAVKSFFVAHNMNQWLLSDYQTFHFLNATEMNSLYSFTDYYCHESKTKTINACLDKVNAQMMLPYYSAGNKNYIGTIEYPNNIFIPVK